MRRLSAGLFLLLCSAIALAQPGNNQPAEGEVEAIGIDGQFRPNCWTPIRVKLRSKMGQPASYRLGVVQEDMDRDRVTYWRPITLTGNPEGQRNEERAWVYFLPQPRDWDKLDARDIVKIYLFSESGQQLVQIPIPPGPASLTSLDPVAESGQSGTRLILYVGTSMTSRPVTDVYDGAHGVMEKVRFSRTVPEEMPTSVLGYQAVDAILWMDADPSAISADLASTLQDYVRDGGRLVICQSPGTWQKIMDSPLAEMLPVVVEGMVDEPGLRSLRRLAGLDAQSLQFPPYRTRSGSIIDPWADTLADPATKAPRLYPIARATTRPAAHTAMRTSIDPALPYLARWRYGLGTVTWIAQDLGDPAIQSTSPLRKLGWDRIWDSLFDWKNRTITADMGAHPNASASPADPNRRYSPVQAQLKYDRWYQDYQRFAPGNVGPDLSSAFLPGMEHGARGAALVALALIFFIGYWIIAGPGAYFFLLSRRQAHLSWIVFGACAVGATVLTVLVVRLVLRGPPQIRHITLARIADGEDAIVHSQIGLYVPRDGNQRITIRETVPRRVSYVSPFAYNPAFQALVDEGFLTYMEYDIPIRQRNSPDQPQVSIPFRSTLKKLQARWVGPLRGIEGRAALSEYARGPSGLLVNSSGRDLRSVFITYAGPPTAQRSEDPVIFLASQQDGFAWRKDEPLDLASTWIQTGPENSRLGRRFGLQTWVSASEKTHFFQFERGHYNQPDRAAFLLSVFDRLEPTQGKLERDASVRGNDVYMAANDRFELRRWTGRHWDASHLLSAGYMLIVARVDEPLPYPMEIQGRTVGGEGTTYYQFIVPIDRTGPAADSAIRDEVPPASRPATRPAPSPPLERAESGSPESLITNRD